jgi:hypothetical protein
MKKYQKVALNIAFLTMILSTGMATNYTRASNLDSNYDSNLTNNEEGLKSSSKKQEKILNTFENNDYASWKKIVGKNNKVNDVIDKVAFNRFVAARIAARNGQYNKALRITEELKKEIENKKRASV